MEVGGPEYKKLKDEVDFMNTQLTDIERTLTRNKATLANSESSMIKVDR